MKIEYAYLTKETILHKLANLNQVTFEVTDACNLKCKYCGYGELYNGYDKRNHTDLSINKAIHLLEYLYEKWKLSDSYNKRTYISFYGGEPLLNMDFIKKIISWISERKIPQCDFTFSMTTNGILLDKYIEYLVENNVHILISLDGNKENNGYRVDFSNKPSFDKVFNNIKLIQNSYEDYFKNNISFNAVLHNRNNYDEIISFFQDKFDKIPSIGELNPCGIREDKIEEYLKIYNNKNIDINNTSDNEKLKEKLFMDNPETSILCTYLHTHSGNIFKSYSELLTDKHTIKLYPTGTCLPFGKKIFLTANGKILPCERIIQKFALGYVDEKKVILNIDNIVKKYNSYYQKYIPQCSKCYNNNTCKECIFYNPDLEGKALCKSFMNKKNFELYREDQYDYLSKHPSLYKKIMTEVIIH